MADETGQLPTQLSPQVLATLFPQQQPQAAVPTTGAPASSPPSTDIMGEMVKASQQGRQVFGEETEKSRGLGSQAEELIRQQASTPVPKMSWLDTQGQPPQGGFLHNIGRALMAIG